MVKCEVLGCSSKLGMEGIALHRFPPNDTPQFLEWHQICGTETGQRMNRRLCSLHFRQDDYKITPKGRRLLESAVPSIAIPPCPEYEVDIFLNARTSYATYFVNVEGVILSLKLKVGGEATPTPTVLIAEKILKDAPVILISTMNQVVSDPAPPPTKLRKLENRLTRVLKDKNHYQKRSTKNREDKNSLKEIHQVKISKIKAKHIIKNNNLVGAHEKQVRSLTEQSNKYLGALQKIFTQKQLALVTSNQKHVNWTHEDIGRFITIRYKSNIYEFLRSQGFPFASTRTLQRFTNKIDFRPGLLFPIIHLLKTEFEDAPEIMRQCILSFDEMSLEGSYAYDAKEDKIYAPSTNINAYFVRGLHDPWKQMVAYELDDNFNPHNILQMISVLEVIGLRVRGVTCDLGGKNRGLLNKLGVQVRKLPSTNGKNKFSVSSFFMNPSRHDDKIWVFPDAPHMLKLIRDNLFKHGFEIEGGHTLTKADFEKLIEVDSAEMQSNHKLGRKHLDVKGLQKTTVSLAVQLLSNTTAALFRKVYPNRPKQALIENAFSVVRKTGAFNTKPSVVDAKQRLKLLCLSMGGCTLTTSAVQGEDNQPLLARMMSSLINVSPTDYPPNPAPLFDVPEEVPTVNMLTLENVDATLRSMGMEQSCESGGKEWVAGYVASKFDRKYPDLVTSDQEKEAIRNLSWVINLNKGGLTIPSFSWRNQCAVLEAEFDHYHSVGGTHQINLQHGVLKSLTETLTSKYPTFPQEPLSLFIRTKMFIRIKAANTKLKEQRREVAQRRWGRVLPEEEEDDQEDEEYIDEEEEEIARYENGQGGQVMNGASGLNWQTMYQNYLDGTL